MMAKEPSGDVLLGGRRGGAASQGRATRRQQAQSLEEASDADRLKEAATDRRAGWHASKAKGNRRNRRYEKRLLSSVADIDLEEDEWGL